MKRLICTLVMSLVAVALLLCYPSIGRAGGKETFLQQKCNKCHTVKSLNIAKLPKTAVAEDADEEEEAGAEKVDPPDLTGMGAKLIREKGWKENATAFLAKFLQKEATTDKGHKHKKKFRGSPDSLKELVDWVISL